MSTQQTEVVEVKTEEVKASNKKEGKAVSAKLQTILI